MPIFVLEGPDLAGKSTLAAALELRHSPARVVHNGPPVHGEQLLTTYMAQIRLASARALQGQTTIFDRLHVGETIYGPIYRGVSQLGAQEIHAIERELDLAGAIKVFVDAEDPTLIARFRGKRGEDFVDSEQALMDIAHQYRLALDTSHDGLLGWARWDWETKPQLDQLT